MDRQCISTGLVQLDRQCISTGLVQLDRQCISTGLIQLDRQCISTGLIQLDRQCISTGLLQDDRLLTWDGRGRSREMMLRHWHCHGNRRVLLPEIKGGFSGIPRLVGCGRGLLVGRLLLITGGCGQLMR